MKTVDFSLCEPVFPNQGETCDGGFISLESQPGDLGQHLPNNFFLLVSWKHPGLSHMMADVLTPPKTNCQE